MALILLSIYDQNTFRTGSASPFSVFSRYNVGTSGTGDRIMQTDQEFAGLCLQCHPKARIDPDTNNTRGTYDRIHDSVLGWAAATGNNANNAMHGYSCSKCHTPHSSCLPRLAITNCLDNNHRGRIATAGGAYPTCHDTPTAAGSWPNEWWNNVTEW